MDLSLQTTRFLYRLRYKLFLPSIFVAIIVAYFTQFLATQYTVTASVFTGIASKGLDEDTRIDYNQLANTFENVISLTKSKSSLEKVSMNLLAQNLMYGNVLKDNKYITAKNYLILLESTPEEVLNLVDKNSLDTTLSNFNKYKQTELDNFFNKIFYSLNSHYSFEALRTIKISRFNMSDLVNLSYTSNDPGITTNTVHLITTELIYSYHTFKFKSSDEIVAYYEEQLSIRKKMLDSKEDELMKYNVENKVINYVEQTKALLSLMTSSEDRIERVLMAYSSSKDLIESLEEHITLRGEAYQIKNEFLELLDQVSLISGKIIESEIFNSQDSLDSEIQNKKKLAEMEKQVEEISHRMHESQYSTEGIVLDNIVDQWLDANILNVKSKAELKVLEERQEDYAMRQVFYSPIGTQINRMERGISVSEQSYLNVLHHLGIARQRQNSIKLLSASPEILTPASYPNRASSGQKRHIYTFAAFIATFIFIMAIEIIIELVDRTLRDPIRVKQLTSLDVIGAFLGPKQFRNRGRTRENNRVAARVVCNKLNNLLSVDNTLYINIFSIEHSEGKSYISQYLKKAWEVQGLTVEILNHDKDYSYGINYLRATSLDFFKHKLADVVLIEYPPLSLQNIPPVFLREASVNIMVANARRGWRTSDDEYLKYLSKDVDNEVVFIINNTEKDYVEYLIGELSMSDRNNTISDRIKQLTFTSNGSSIR